MEPAHAAFLDAWRAQDFHVPRGPWPRPAPPKPLLSFPVQLSLFDMDDEPAAPPAAPQPPSALLTAIIDAAGVGRRRPRDIATVEAAIAESIPVDVPTFVDEILSVRRDGEDLIARVRVFDGGLVLLTVNGGPEPSVREWEAEGDQRAFHYANGAWARFDEAEAALSADEIAVIESCLPYRYSYGPQGDAVRDRWRAWISEGATVEEFSVSLKGKGSRMACEVTRTRLGWLSSYDYHYPNLGGVGGGGDGPHMDGAGFYIWDDREAAIQHAAHVAWNAAAYLSPGQTADTRARIQAEFEKAGVDVTVEPGCDRRRRLITKERIAALVADRGEPGG